MICDWYSTGLHKTVEDFGNYQEPTATVASRTWIRQDVLAVEMVRLGEDIEEEGPKRLQKALEYIRHMRGHEWGSTPEYTAFAFMAKMEIHVFQPRPGKQSAQFPGLSCVNAVKPASIMGRVNLLYDGHSHYDLLLEDDAAETLLDICPSAKIVAF